MIKEIEDGGLTEMEEVESLNIRTMSSETPLSLKRRRLEHKIEIEDLELENHYDCCIGKKTDKRVLIYLTQVGFGISVMTFCAAQLFIDDSCDRTSIYLPLLTSVLAYFLPSPSLSKKD